MRSASAAPDGAIAPTRRGADIQDRKNERKSLGMRTPASWLRLAGQKRGGQTIARVHCDCIACGMPIASILSDWRQQHPEACAADRSVLDRDVAAMQEH